MRKVIRISADGTVSFIYDDALSGLLQEGQATVTRASHVEPETIYGEICWYANMAPVAGPLLGPYTTREEALAKEVEWLNRNGIPIPRK